MSGKRDAGKHWNSKYRANPRGWLRPDPFLELAHEQFVVPQFPEGGVALDLAAGAGRNSIWLARHGWNVTHIDISETAMELAKQRAGPLATRIHFVVDDLTRFRASQATFDLVLGFFYLDREIFPDIFASIRSRGFLLYKTFMFDAEKVGQRPKNPDFLLRSEELLALTAGLKILHYQETHGWEPTAEIAAQKTK